MGTENKSKRRRRGRKETKPGQRNAAGEFTIHDVCTLVLGAAVRCGRVARIAGERHARRKKKGPNFPLEPQILPRYFDPLGIPLEGPLSGYSSISPPSLSSFFLSSYHNSFSSISFLSLSFLFVANLLPMLEVHREMHDSTLLLRLVTKLRCQERHCSFRSNP